MPLEACESIQLDLLRCRTLVNSLLKSIAEKESNVNEIIKKSTSITEDCNGLLNKIQFHAIKEEDLSGISINLNACKGDDKIENPSSPLLINDIQKILDNLLKEVNQHNYSSMREVFSYVIHMKEEGGSKSEENTVVLSHVVCNWLNEFSLTIYFAELPSAISNSPSLSYLPYYCNAHGVEESLPSPTLTSQFQTFKNLSLIVNKGLNHFKSKANFLISFLHWMNFYHYQESTQRASHLFNTPCQVCNSLLEQVDGVFLPPLRRDYESGSASHLFCKE